MLDLCPRWILRYLPFKNKQYGAYVFTGIGIACAAYFYLSGYWQASSILASGYSIFSKIRSLTHAGFRCPLCGGTRSFIALFAGDLKAALHYSLFGTGFFLTTYMLWPLRLCIALGKDNCCLRLVLNFDCWLAKYFVHLILLSYVLQLVLDKTKILPWLA